MKEISIKEFNAIPWHGPTGSHYQDWVSTHLSTERAIILMPDEFPLDVSGNQIKDHLAMRLAYSVSKVYGKTHRLCARTLPDGSVALLVTKKKVVANAKT